MIESTTSPPTPILWNVDTLAEALAVSAATIHRWSAGGKLPAPLRLSRGSIRWRKSEIEQWIAAGCPSRRVWEAMQSGPAGRKAAHQ